MAETRFDDWIAPRYERLWPELFDPVGGPALEFGIGTGRLAAQTSHQAPGTVYSG
jgi:hypothetical protein